MRSATSAPRPIEMPPSASRTDLRASSIVSPLLACRSFRKSAVYSVMIQPGETALTRTPLGPSSLEIDLLYVRSAALAAA